jgi:NAD(P)-dependent dehydrogenase (short-subunit alcohol dehydrogenase family)
MLVVVRAAGTGHLFTFRGAVELRDRPRAVSVRWGHERLVGCRASSPGRGSAKDAAHEVAERHGVQTIGVGCDVTDETSVESGLAALDGSTPPVGALANNAGITSPTPFLEVTGQEWDRVFAVNVRGAYNITRRVEPGMAERGFGRIVSSPPSRPYAAAASSAASPTPRPRPHSSGSPARSPASWAPKGITASSAAPGPIGTDITGGALEGERKAQLLAGTPVGRIGNVHDVADLITYLCREESGYITGATHDVNGGSHIL